MPLTKGIRLFMVTTLSIVCSLLLLAGNGWPAAATPEVGSETKTGMAVSFLVGEQTRWVNGEPGWIDTAPVLIENRAMLPIRHLAEPLGWTFEWTPYEVAGVQYRMTTISKGNTRVRVWIDHPMAQISHDGGENWENRRIDPENPQVRPLIMGPGRTMLPLRFVAENLGYTVNWDQSTRLVTIYQ